jgi:hypothetical protein
MRTTTLLVAAAGFAFSSGVALAQNGGGGGEPATGGSTSTSVGAPADSPNYSAPRSAVVPGTPPQERDAEQANQGTARQQAIERGKIPQAPKNPITGHAQTTPTQ